MKKKVFLIVFFVGIALFFLALPFSVFLSKPLAYYAYKEIVYRTVINDTVGRETNPKKVALLLMEYLHQNLFTPGGAQVVDKDVYNDLVRGIAWCDQRSWALGTFAGKSGIDNRMLMTRNPQEASKHTVSEVLIGGKWAMLDPLYGLVFYNDKGELASYDEVCAKPSLFYASTQMLKLKKIDRGFYEKTKDYFTKNIFYNNPQPPKIWGNPVRKKDKMRFFITRLLDFYQGIFGDFFSHRFQDFYLAVTLEAAGSNPLYFRARNYEVMYRYQSAISEYVRFLSSFPKDPDAENALFFLGVLYQKTGNAKLSVSTLEELLKSFPQTKWSPYVDYYLGRAYESLKQVDVAKNFYLKSIAVHTLTLEPYVRLYDMIHKNSGGGK